MKGIDVLYVVSPEKRQVFVKELGEYFKLRKRVLIDQRGWDLKSDNGKETDSFDHEQAHYLIYKSPHTGEVSAGVRLTPTTAPNLTTDLFSNLIDPSKGFCRSINVWECSRLVTEPCKTREPKRLIREATSVLFIGMIEYGLRLHYRQLLTMTEVRLERIGRLNAWCLQRLGKVEQVGNTKAVTGLLEVSQNIRAKMRKKSGISRNIFWDEGEGNKEPREPIKP